MEINEFKAKVKEFAEKWVKENCEEGISFGPDWWSNSEPARLMEEIITEFKMPEIYGCDICGPDWAEIRIFGVLAIDENETLEVLITRDFRFGEDLDGFIDDILNIEADLLLISEKTGFPGKVW